MCLYFSFQGGSEVLTEHAGFLMALGLNGHLNTLAVLNKFEYLVKCHEMTSVGLLLGIAASKRGMCLKIYFCTHCEKLVSYYVMFKFQAQWM